MRVSKYHFIRIKYNLYVYAVTVCHRVKSLTFLLPSFIILFVNDQVSFCLIDLGIFSCQVIYQSWLTILRY